MPTKFTPAATARIKSPPMSRALTASLAFLLAALIAACSSTLPDNAPAWPPADYRKIIRDSADYRKIIRDSAGYRKIIRDSKEEIPDKEETELAKGVQVSEPRKTIAPQLYDWVVCL